MAFTSYDQIQADAKLKTCKGCKRPFYFTRVTRVKCADCRKAAK